MNAGADALSRLDTLTRDQCKALLSKAMYKRRDFRDSNVFLLDLLLICRQQDSNQELIEIKQKQPTCTGTVAMAETELTTYQNKIWIPGSIRQQLLHWYHQNLQHAGMQCMIKTISLHFDWQGFRKDIKTFVKTCDSCQRAKITGIGHAGHGIIPETKSLHDKQPWSQVRIDCMGEFPIKVKQTGTNRILMHKLRTLTCVDAGTNCCKLAVMTDTPNAAYVA